MMRVGWGFFDMLICFGREVLLTARVPGRVGSRRNPIGSLKSETSVQDK